MRALCRLARAALVAAAVLGAASARAEPAADEAKRHFLTGVRLYQDHNYAAAIAEFEASYELRPTAVSMQNLAVCQKASFRYVDAIATLEKMLKQFGATLTEEDRVSAERAIREMNALLGSVVIHVEPAGAAVTLDGRPLSDDALRAPIRLAAGEYRIAAEAPGYQRKETLVRVVSGQKEQPVVLELAELRPRPAEAPPTDSSTALAPGPSAGAAPTTPAATAAAAAPSAPHPDEEVALHGFYGLLTLTGYSAPRLSAKPTGFDSIDTGQAGGLGLRIGYRKSALLAVEGILESASGHVAAKCLPSGADCSHELSTVHIAAAARLSTRGARGRFFGLGALGIASSSIKPSQDGSPLGSDSGAGAFVTFEGGYELNVGHVLLEAALVLLAQGTGLEAYERKGISQGGLSLRAGYGQW